tara:strand:- start:184 stop:429 length:246 start_codon:yes stop_codon:yes gene_type:complete
MDTKVFDIYSEGIGKRVPADGSVHMFRGFDSLKDLETYVRACGVDNPNMLIALVVATLRNVLDDQLEAQAAIADDLEAELN